jgi:hypothetical protein
LECDRGLAPAVNYRAIRHGRVAYDCSPHFSSGQVGTGQEGTGQVGKETQSEPAKETTLSSAVNLLELVTKILIEQLAREREYVDDLRIRLTRAETLLTDQRPVSRKWFWQKH